MRWKDIPHDKVVDSERVQRIWPGKLLDYLEQNTIFIFERNLSGAINMDEIFETVNTIGDPVRAICEFV